MKYSKCSRDRNPIKRNPGVRHSWLIIPLLVTGLLSCILPACAANLLVNPGFESGTSGWTGYSPVTWGNYGVYNDYKHGGNNAFWVRGAWNWPQPNWMGAYQKAVSAPGCIYQADGFIFSPSGYGTRGDTTVGDFGWIGIDGTQNYAWLEVTFRDSANNMLALYRSAVFDSTAPQDTWVESPITNQFDPSTYALTGTVSSLVAPPGTVIVQYQVVFEQANWNHGAAWFDDLSLNQIAGPVPPTIGNISPDGTQLFTPTNAFTFTASSATTDINPSGIHVIANGIDVSSQLVIGTDPRNRTASLALKSNTVYNISMTVTDAVNFYASATATFDTFATNTFTWEAEDFDFNGGQFIDNPLVSSYATAGSYYFQSGWQGVDENDTGHNGPQNYRYNSGGIRDFMSVDFCPDIVRDRFLAAQAAGDAAASDFNIGYFDSGEWVNYTRTFPSGRYNVYARLAGGSGAGVLHLGQVTSGQGTSNQTVVALGDFAFNGSSWSSYRWVPLADSYGNPIAVTLGGVETLRATSGGGANLNFFALVPAKLDQPVITGMYPDGTRLFQATNKFSFVASSPSTTIPTGGIQLVLNGMDVSSQLSISGSSLNKTVSFAGLKSNQTYTAAITLIDVNNNVASSTVNFDTFMPVLQVEGEDWDFNNGQFIDNPIVSSSAGSQSYFNKVGVQGIDESETGAVNTNWSTTATVGDGGPGDHAFRTNDTMAAGVAGDIARQVFVDAVVSGDVDAKDYALGWFNPGEWVNYTRTFPAGTYNVYGRLSNGNGATANAYLDLVTSGRGTVNQTSTRLGTFTYQARGWSSYDYVPLRDKYGNLVSVTLGGVNTLRLTSGPLGGGVNVNFLMLVPARMDLPAITQVWPDGTTLLQGTNSFSFVASNPTIPISPSGIQVTFNGFDVSPQATLAGSPNNWNVSIPLAQSYTNYAAVIKLTDNNSNVVSYTVYFDTFYPTNFTWEAEDWDFGGGQFIDNPGINAYYGDAFVGQVGVDEDYVTYDGTATFAYRQFDYLATQACTDTPLPAFAASALTNSTITNYNVGWWVNGAWMNYTRTWPTNTFFVYARLAGNVTYHVQLDQITRSYSPLTDLGTNHLGTFSVRGRGWQMFDWVPLMNNGQMAAVALGGVSTLRTTTDGNCNANLYMLVPASAVQGRFGLRASASGGSIALSFPTQLGHNYGVYYKNDLADANWQPLTLVGGDGTVKIVHDATGGSKRFYRVAVE